jgi:hypothetical protein
MEKALKLAFADIRFVNVLESFANFKQSVEQYLNNANTTPGN